LTNAECKLICIQQRHVKRFKIIHEKYVILHPHASAYIDHLQGDG